MLRARSRHAALALLAGLALVLSLVGTSTPSQAATPVGIIAFPTLDSIDCVTATACVAVGSHYFQRTDQDGQVHYATKPLVTTWNGKVWRETAFPRISQQQTPFFRNAVLDSVSCAPGKSGGLYCLATGSYYARSPSDTTAVREQGPLTAVFSGTAWRIVEQPSKCVDGDACVTRDQVQCTSAKHCYAVGYLPGAAGSDQVQNVTWTWNGTAWRHQPAPVALTGLSCWADDHCLAVGGVQHPTTTSSFEIRAGSSVSCADAGYCMILSSGASHLVKPGGVTRYPLKLANSVVLGPVSCPKRGFCMTVGERVSSTGHYTRAAERFTRTQWVVTHRPGPSVQRYPYLNDVACAGPSLCFATGPRYSTKVNNPTGDPGLVTRWTGSSWQDQRVYLADQTTA